MTMQTTIPAVGQAFELTVGEEEADGRIVAGMTCGFRLLLIGLQIGGIESVAEVCRRDSIPPGEWLRVFHSHYYPAYYPREGREGIEKYDFKVGLADDFLLPCPRPKELISRLHSQGTPVMGDRGFPMINQYGHLGICRGDLVFGEEWLWLVAAGT